MTNDTLRRRFEDLTLSPDEFTHEAHVRVAWSYLVELPLLDALRTFSANLQRFARSLGAEGKYHATITWAYLFAISERIESGGERNSFERFAAGNPDLLARDFLSRFYPPEVLASEAARARFLLPRMPDSTPPLSSTAGELRAETAGRENHG